MREACSTLQQYLKSQTDSNFVSGRREEKRWFFSPTGQSSRALSPDGMAVDPPSLSFSPPHFRASRRERRGSKRGKLTFQMLGPLLKSSDLPARLELFACPRSLALTGTSRFLNFPLRILFTPPPSISDPLESSKLHLQ